MQLDALELADGREGEPDEAVRQQAFQQAITQRIDRRGGT